MTTEPTEIRTEDDYRLAVRELGKRSRPTWGLRTLMNALESYRQARKMGWSRKQNKDGVTTFASFELDTTVDRPLIEAAVSALELTVPSSSDHDVAFVHELLGDADLRGFVFVHDVVEGGARWEGATVSLGRVAKDAPRHRDRLDVIVERAVENGVSAGPGRMRVYVDPFLRPLEEHPAAVLGPVPLAGPGRSLLREVSQFYLRFRDVPEKAWRHWTQDYIDYFGPRTEPVQGTVFPTRIDELAELHRRTARAAATAAAARAL